MHQALFQNGYEVQRSACLLGKDLGCDHLPSPYAAMTDTRPGPGVYADTSSQLVSKDVRFLGVPARFQQALAAVRLAATVPPETNPVAAALLQHDLWERFDTLDAVVRSPEPDLLSSTADPLHVLRDEIGVLMRRLALPKSVLYQLPSNLKSLVDSYPDLLGGLPDGKWLEVATRSRERPDAVSSPFREGTRHSLMAGYRSAFRRFATVPESAGGAGWLRQALREQPSTLKLPVGAHVVIFEVPLVVSSEVEIVPLPLITLLESRTARPFTDVSHPLRDLGFEVLEARRPWLRTPGFRHGGLFRMPYDAPFPLGGSCGPNPTTLLPMRATCVLCHGPAGDHLTGTLSHGNQQLRVSDDADLQIRSTIGTKQGRPDFAALRALFKAP